MRANRRKKPINLKTFFSDFIPLAQPLHQTLQFIDAIAQHHHLAYQRLNLAQRHFRHRIVVVHSRIMRFRLFGRLAHDVLVALPACDIAFDALVSDDRWAQSRGNEDRSWLLPLQIPPHAVDLEFPRIRDSAVRHRVDRRQCTQVFDFRSTELSLRHIRPL